MPILRWYDLLDYVDSSLHFPAEVLPAENNEEPKISHAFLNWKRQDQLLFSWIISTLIEGVHAQIMGLTTSQRMSITTKFDPINLNDLYGMLLSQDIQLSDQHGMLDIGSPSANLATTPNYNSRRGCGSQFANHGHSGRRRGRGQGYGQQQNNNSHFGNQQGNHLQCRQCFNHAFQPDSGVNLNALHIKIGNGTSLSIKNIGSSKLIKNNATFAFHNILHMPSICHHLLSVNQFTKDNDVVLEIHPSHFVVKDRSTGRGLLHRPTKDGLYQLEVAKKRNNKSTGSTFFGEKLP
ncbi:hypothetical protein AMTRI_Chr11g152880 [Amborella trichopoda]